MYFANVSHTVLLTYSYNLNPTFIFKKVYHKFYLILQLGVPTIQHNNVGVSVSATVGVVAFEMEISSDETTVWVFVAMDVDAVGHVVKPPQ